MLCVILDKIFPYTSIELSWRPCKRVLRWRCCSGCGLRKWQVCYWQKKKNMPPIHTLVLHLMKMTHPMKIWPCFTVTKLGENTNEMRVIWEEKYEKVRVKLTDGTRKIKLIIYSRNRKLRSLIIKTTQINPRKTITFSTNMNAMNGLVRRPVHLMLVWHLSQ